MIVVTLTGSPRFADSESPETEDSADGFAKLADRPLTFYDLDVVEYRS